MPSRNLEKSRLSGSQPRSRSRGLAAGTTSTTKPTKAPSNTIPPPFHPAPASLKPLTDTLYAKDIYIIHLDHHPARFKRTIFLIPIAIHLFIAACFLLRTWYIFPWYAQLFGSALGYYTPEAMVTSADGPVPLDTAHMPWDAILMAIVRRAVTFLIDFLLSVFVWPWPLDFVVGQTRGSPVRWRWAVGFRDTEIYVRYSRDWRRREVGDDDDAFLTPESSAHVALMAHVRPATARLMTQEKTGYLTINEHWHLDFATMVYATRLMDRRALDAGALMAPVVLIHHRDHGWLTVKTEPKASQEEGQRRRQMFAFRDALIAVGKEDLFYRWIEMVQFESSRPGGFDHERQIDLAKQINDLFVSHGINFDEFWKESVGGDGW